MERLEPFEKLEKDYYLGERDGWYSDGENRDSDRYAALSVTVVCQTFGCVCICVCVLLMIGRKWRKQHRDAFLLFFDIGRGEG